MADEIKEGDVVQLKSGGPKMTVKKVGMWNGKLHAFCEWFVDDKNHEDVFLPTSLKRVE
jgi:uncharacterized protein YodC (DUF2158 family)